MKGFHSLLLFFIFSVFISCGGEVPSNQTTDTPVTDSTAQTPDNQTDTEPQTNSNSEKPNCEVAGTILDGNVFWAKEANLLVCVAATEETKDSELGDSHRMLEIYDGSTCEMIDSKVLPINVSADFPYQIADRTYNKLTQIVAIRGANIVYCYNARTQVLSDPLTPKFINERFLEDASSGMINHLEVWENYLIGYAQGMGTFVFDLSENTPKSVEPFAEFEISEGELYNSMFMLKSGENAYQVILPKFDFDTEKLSIETVFDEPKNLDTQINPRYRNNQFQVLRETVGGKKVPYVIDMKKMQKLDLPNNLVEMKNSAIIEWAKEQN